MTNELRNAGLPPVVDRATWQAEHDVLLAREKAHTHEGDAIAAARRRLPMVEVDATVPLIGPNGPVPLLDVFEGRRQLIAYFHMWHDGRSAADQCEGCTFFNGDVNELSYLHSRDVTYATFAQGTYDEIARYHDFMGMTCRGTRRGTRPRGCSPGGGSASWRATCGRTTGCSRPTGPPTAASSR
ncbi:MAG TPA: DUF899 family protein [Pseudonocardiaceae bacterium]